MIILIILVITSNLNKKLKLFSDFYLPIEMIKKTNYELVNGEKTYTKEEAKQEAKKSKRYNTIMMIISVVSMMIAAAAWLLPNILGGVS